jgi:hypothetical protein
MSEACDHQWKKVGREHHRGDLNYSSDWHQESYYETIYECTKCGARRGERED